MSDRHGLIDFDLRQIAEHARTDRPVLAAVLELLRVPLTQAAEQDAVERMIGILESVISHEPMGDALAILRGADRSARLRLGS